MISLVNPLAGGDPQTSAAGQVVDPKTQNPSSLPKPTAKPDVPVAVSQAGQLHSRPAQPANDETKPSPAQFTIAPQGGSKLAGVVLNSASVVIAGQTVAAGGTAVQVHSHLVSVDPDISGIVVDGQTHALPSPIALHPVAAGESSFDPEITNVQSNKISTSIDGYTIQAAPTGSLIIINGQSVVRGAGTATFSGTPVALHSNGDLVLGVSTHSAFYPSIAQNPPPVLTVGTHVLTIASDNIMAGGSTLGAASHGVTVDGTVISLGKSEIQLGTSVIPLSAYETTAAPHAVTVSGVPISFKSENLMVGSSTINAATLSPGAVITAAGQSVTVLPSGVVVDGTTITANAPAVTFANTPISLGTDGLVIGTSTIPASVESSISAVTIGGQTLALSHVAGGVAIAGTTLHAGGASQSGSSEQVLGGLILSAFGKGPGASSSGNGNTGGSGHNPLGASVSVTSSTNDAPGAASSGNSDPGRPGQNSTGASASGTSFTGDAPGVVPQAWCALFVMIMIISALHQIP